MDHAPQGGDRRPVRKIPFLVLGDGPQEPTGLGRIARDLTAQLVAADLPLDIVQVGGAALPLWTAWRHVPLDERDRNEAWGAPYVERLWAGLWGRQPGILFAVWDPSRLYPYLSAQIPAQRWAYTAIDAQNIQGRIGGPAGDALQRFDRILAYGRWASQVIRATGRPRVPYLPHGLMLDTYAEPASETEQAWVQEQVGPYWITQKLIGCVATNQPRKDLGLWCLTLAELRRRGHAVYGWLHTDTLVKDWSLQQLVEDCGLQKALSITLGDYTDRQLACLYQSCSVTMAPGLGEGFGYPLVESLASGVPVVHGDAGGGAELLPKLEWRFPIRASRLESVYALKRPVFDPVDAANAIERAWDWQAQVGPDVARAYLRGSVAHLGWPALWPRWRSWFTQGLES